MEEKLIIAVVGFPVIYDVSLFAYRDINKTNNASTKVSDIVAVPGELLMCITVLYIYIYIIFPLERLFFSGNSINLLKTIPRLVNVSYNVEIILALNHEHKSTPHKWLLIGLFS